MRPEPGSVRFRFGGWPRRRSSSLFAATGEENPGHTSRQSCGSWSRALASRRDAQYLRIRSAMVLRCSSLIVRFRLPTALAACFLPRPAPGGTLPSIS